MVRIILVDDEKPALREMCDELREQGWEVDAFSGPREALDALQKSSYDLGVFDIRMPGMSGVELLDKAKRWQTDMDVIFITAHPALATAIDALQLGVLEYLQRPFRLQALVQAISRVCTYRFLRKLDALGSLVDGFTLTQALQEMFHETMLLVTRAISPRYTYIAFIEWEGVGSVVEHHGLTDIQAASLVEQIVVTKHWLNARRMQSVSSFNVSDDSSLPLYLNQMKTVIGVPLFYKKQMVGGILCGAQSEGVFSIDAERFFTMIGHLISHAITRFLTTHNMVRQHYQDTGEYFRAVVKELAPNLKNPLTVIGARAQQALNTLDPTHPLFEELQSIYEQARLADEQLEELLGFGYSTDVLELKRHNLSVLVGETAEVMQNSGISEDIDLVVDLQTQTVPVACDALQLKRALRNVIQNAIQDTEDYGGGKVMVKVSVENGSALIRVHNTGEPSPQEHWEELFNAHMTSPSVATDKYQRSEDGLPVARGILRSHGGDVTVEASQEGQGTTLLITLPLDIMQ